MLPRLGPRSALKTTVIHKLVPGEHDRFNIKFMLIGHILITKLAIYRHARCTWQFPEVVQVPHRGGEQPEHVDYGRLVFGYLWNMGLQPLGCPRCHVIPAPDLLGQAGPGPMWEP